jgi:hypothetical protein
MCEGTRLFAALEEEVHRQVPLASVRVLGTEPVVGAVVAAARRAGNDSISLVDDVRTSWSTR